MLDAELRKAFEVALHAGTAAALLIGLRAEVGETARGLDRRRLTLLVLSFAPAGALAFLFERPIERRLGTPATTAAGLVLGALAMAAADRMPQERERESADGGDGAGARDRPGVRARARRLAQRRDARRRALAALHARGRERALAPRGAAADPRGDGAEGLAAVETRAAARRARGVRARDGRLVRLDARLDLADQAGRARPLAGALRGVSARRSPRLVVRRLKRAR